MNTNNGTLTADSREVTHKTSSKFLLRSASTILLTVLVTGGLACAKKNSEPGTTQVIVKQGGDGSGGGNTTVTSPKIVRDHLSQIKSRMLTILNRVRAWDKDRENQITIKNVDDFFSDKSLENVIKNMKVNVQDGPCNPPGSDEKAGYGYPKTQTVCFSVNELAKLPNESVSIEIDALAFHEVGHLLVKEESECQMIQKWLVDQPWIVDLKNTHIGPMLSAYDMALKELGDIAYRASNKHSNRLDACRSVSAFETRMSVLDQELDVPRGSIWRRSLVPRSLKPISVAPEMRLVMNWGNKVCSDQPFSIADRIKLLEGAIGAAEHLTKRRIKLAQYQSQDNVYSEFASNIGALELTYAPVMLKAFREGFDMSSELLFAKRTSCKLTALADGTEIQLEKGDHIGDLKTNIVDQAGEARPLKIGFFWQGAAVVQTSFSKSDIHVIQAPQNARSASYFENAVIGVHIPLASVNGYRSFQMDFFVTDRGVDFAKGPTGKTYRLICQTP